MGVTVYLGWQLLGYAIAQVPKSNFGYNATDGGFADALVFRNAAVALVLMSNRWDGAKKRSLMPLVNP